MKIDQEFSIAGRADVDALLDQLALAMLPAVDEGTALVGVLRRGVPLAHALARRIKSSSGQALEVGELRLKRYSDELELLHELPELDEGSLSLDPRGRHLIVVDDVLYTGESLLRAVGFLRARGAARMQVAVLAARCGRTMPVHAEFVGCTLDVRPDWVIHCLVPPYEPELGLSIARLRAGE